MIPCWIIEEHHEAFYVWHEAIKLGVIPRRGNCLLHVDEHSDLGIPLLRTPLSALQFDPDRVKEFTYTELSIINFICPALYLGIFKTLYWLRQCHDRDVTDRILYISSTNCDGKNLKLESKITLANWWQPDRKAVNFHYLHPHQVNLNVNTPIVLDIDLDYFSCDNAQGAYFEVEITPEAYRDLRDNIYHKARLNLGNELNILERDGKFYLCTDLIPLTENLQVSPQQITDRVYQFGNFLVANSICPALINICRSRLSGYTPAHQWQFIETQLIDRLQSLYPLELMSISTIVKP